MKVYTCRAIINGVKVSFLVEAYSLKEAITGAYSCVVDICHGTLLTVKGGRR